MSALSISNSAQSAPRGDPRIVIAVLDGPIDLTHPCFAGADITPLQSIASPEPNGGAATAHGTHVASIIFGQPGSDVVGIAPACRGLSIPIFNDTERTDLACSQLDLARAIFMALEHGAHVINISGGQLASSIDADGMLAQAIETCARRNVLVVAAAGNDGCDCLHVPAAIDTVLAVGAMDDDGHALASSNWGKAYLTQGLLAPGLNVLGAAPGGGITRRSGTSFAAPYVSGIAALLLSRQLAAGLTPDPHTVRAALLRSARPCVADEDGDCRRVLAGRIDPDAAFDFVTGGVHHVSDTTIIVPESAGQNFVKPATLDAPATPSPISFVPSAHAPGHLGSGIRMSEDVGFARVQPSAEPSVQPPPQIRSDVGQITPSCGGDKECGCGGAGKPGGCGCGGGVTQKPQLVYALGSIGYDFGTEARRDSYLQAMQASAANPFTDLRLIDYLASDPSEAQGIIWTLNLDATPIYAVQPAGPFAATGYERLREFLDGSLRQGVELVSVPGVIAGTTRLQSGQVVPVIVPAVRGMFAWATQPLVELALGARPSGEKAQATYDEHARGLSDFLNRVYYDLRNLGITPEDRALNYSATNAVQISAIIRSTTSEALDLDTLHVKRSPICRPDSECYDVELSFFNPNNTNIASRIYRFTIDVSDVIPVSIGATRSWARR